ncbi:hypothetical protein DMENIID0001_103750 [Sergentomyia squamirostris]
MENTDGNPNEISTALLTDLKEDRKIVSSPKTESATKFEILKKCVAFLKNKNSDIQLEALAILSDGFSLLTKETILAAIPHLLALLNPNTTTVKVITHALLLISTIIKNHDDREKDVKVFMENNFISRLRQLLDSSSIPMIIAVLTCIINITSIDTYITSFIGSGGLSKLLKLMNHREPNIVRNVVKIVMILIKDPGQRQAVLKTIGIEKCQQIFQEYYSKFVRPLLLVSKL